MYTRSVKTVKIPERKILVKPKVNAQGEHAGENKGRPSEKKNVSNLPKVESEKQFPRV